MQYNIHINQKGLENDTQISLTDASVIDWLHTFCGSNNRKINAQKVDGWTWVNCSFLINDMPLLRIKSRAGGAKLLHRLKDLGYIEVKTEQRKLFVKITDKMDNLYVENSKTQVVSPSLQSCQPQDTNHNTNTIILDNKEVSSEEKGIILNPQQGKSPVARLQSLYSLLFRTLYGFKPKPTTFPQTGGVFKQLLKDYSEIQVACLLIVFFNWQGMKDNEPKERDWLIGQTHSIYLFKGSVSKYEAYIRNYKDLSKEFDDDKELYNYVRKSISELNNK